MAQHNQLFTAADLMRMQVTYKQARKDYWMSLFLLPVLVLVSVILLIAVGLEYELMFRLFEYLSGEEGYYTPHLMAFSGLVMMVGYHFMAKKHPGNFAVRFVETLSPILLVAYALGAGLYIAVQIYSDGAGDSLSLPNFSGGFESFGDATGGNWTDSLFENITSPLASILLCAGIGALTTISLYIAHHAISIIEKNGKTFYDMRGRSRDVIEDYATVRAAQKDYGDLHADLNGEQFKDREFFSFELAAHAIEEIIESLGPLEHWLKEAQYGSTDSILPGPVNGVDVKQVAKDVEKIKALSLDNILENLKPPKTTEKLR